MSVQEIIQSITVLAGGDLSAGQFRFVELAADGKVDLVSSAGGDAIGVLQNKPDAENVAATVAVAGVVKVVIGVGDLTTGDKVQSDASGEAILAATGDHVLGRAITGGSAGEVGEVLLMSHHILA